MGADHDDVLERAAAELVRTARRLEALAAELRAVAARPADLGPDEEVPVW